MSRQWRLEVAAAYRGLAKAFDACGYPDRARLAEAFADKWERS